MTNFEKYLRGWLDWAENDGENDGPYCNYYGLCSNVYCFGASEHELEEINNQLLTALDADFGVKDYPFGEFNYEFRSRNDTQHLDPDRLAWVKKTIARLEKERNQND